MTSLQKLEQPVAVTLTAGQWDVVLTLVTVEWFKVRQEQGREAEAYTKTLHEIRQRIIRETE
jgi:hypothetical protein